MKRILILILFLACLSHVKAQTYQNIGSATWQRAPTAKGYMYRINMATLGFAYWYTASQIDSLINAHSAGVTSFKGRTGAVVPVATDYASVGIDLTSSSLTQNNGTSLATSMNPGVFTLINIITNAYTQLKSNSIELSDDGLHSVFLRANALTSNISDTIAKKSGTFALIPRATGLTTDSVWVIRNEVSYKVAQSSITGTAVASVSGTANRITSTGGLNPVINISSTFEGLLGKVANPLSQFAVTSSAQLAGTISDETGTGSLVFSNSPTLVTPNIGTATGNITGNAATVTTIPILSGDVSNTGNSVNINTLNGITKSYYDPTSSIQTQLNGKQSALTLTTTGSSGASTLSGSTLNIPTPTIIGLGGDARYAQLNAANLFTNGFSSQWSSNGVNTSYPNTIINNTGVFTNQTSSIGVALTQNSVLFSNSTIAGFLQWAPTGSNKIVTIPDANTTIVGTDVTQTLTNKSVDKLLVTGTAGSGYIDWISQSIHPTGVAGHLKLYRDSAGAFSYMNGIYRRTFSIPKAVDQTIRYPWKANPTLGDSTEISAAYIKNNITATPESKSFRISGTGYTAGDTIKATIPTLTMIPSGSGNPFIVQSISTNNKTTFSGNVLSQGGFSNGLIATANTQGITRSDAGMPTGTSITYTVQEWIKPTSSTNVANVLVSYGSSTTGLEINIFNDGGVNVINGATTVFIVLTGKNMIDGNWHNVAVRINGAVCTVFVDGTSFAATNLNTYNVSLNGTLKTNGLVGTKGIIGYSDQLLIYNTAVSTSDIQANYNVGVGTLSVATTGLIARYEYEGTLTDTNPNVTPVTATFLGSTTYAGTGNGKVPVVGSLGLTPGLSFSDGVHPSGTITTMIGDATTGNSENWLIGIYNGVLVNGKYMVTNNAGGTRFSLSNTNAVPTNSAIVTLDAGSATAGTAPLKLTSGTNLTTAEAGAIEFDGTDLYYTTSTPTRRTVVNLAATQTLTNKTLTSPNLNSSSVVGQVWTATNTTGAGNWATNASAARTMVVSSAATLTLALSTDYAFSGTTAVYTLPAITASAGGLYQITIKNRGTGTITVNSAAGGNDIYDTAAVNTIAILPGAAVTLMPDATYFNRE